MKIEEIINDIERDSFITEKKLAQKYHCHDRTIRRYIKIVKEKGILEIKNSGIRKEWIIKKKL